MFKIHFQVLINNSGLQKEKKIFFLVHQGWYDEKFEVQEKCKEEEEEAEMKEKLWKTCEWRGVG